MRIADLLRETVGWKKDLPGGNYSSMIGWVIEEASWSRDFGGFPRPPARYSEPERERSQLLELRLHVAAEYCKLRRIDCFIMFSQKIAQQSLRRRMSLYKSPSWEKQTNMFPLSVAVQQPSAMRLSMAKFASPAAVATGQYMQMRSVELANNR